MKVLQINCVYVNGSTGRLCSQINAYLEKHGEEAYVAHGIPDVAGKNAYVINNSIDAHIHSFLSRKLCLQGKMSFWATYRLVRYIKRLSPDLIHLHNLHGHYLNYEMLFRFLSKSEIPVVWTLHDCWAMTGKCAHFAAAGCEKWKTEEGCRECPQLNTYPDSTYDRSSKNFADKKRAFTSVSNLTIVTVSEWLKTVCEHSFLQDKRIVCIPNGIDTGVFRPTEGNVREKYGLPNKKIVLGVSSIWNGQKGEKHFIRLADMLPEDYQLVLVGKNSQKIAEQNSKIIALPRTENQKELAMIYSMSSVFLILSVEDSGPLVVSEAMACGTPVIGFASTGITELIHPGMGYVCEVNDVEAVRKRILDICSEGKDYKSACVHHVQESHSIESMTECYYRLYCEILEAKDGR